MDDLSLLQETKMQIRCVIVSSPLNVNVSQLAKDYRNITGECVPFSRLGFNSLIDFLRSIPDVVKVIGRNPQSATVKPIITENLANLNNLITKQKVRRPESGYVPRRKNETNTTYLTVENINYTKKIQPFCKPSNLSSNKSSNIPYEQNQNSVKNSNFITSQKTQPDISGNKTIGQGKSLMIIPPTQTVSLSDVMGPQDKIESMWSGESRIVEGSEHKIYICESCDPTRFWFVLYDDEYFYTMTSLMKDMCCLYEDSKDYYRVPSNLIQPHMYCAAFVDGNWHRAYVIDAPTKESTVKIFLIDYGSVTIVNVSCILYLLKTYQILKSQAIRGRLDYIIPKDTKVGWTKSAIDNFDEQTDGNCLAAHFTETDAKNQIVWMVATLTELVLSKSLSSYDRITLNESLVSRDYAQINPINMGCNRNLNPFSRFQNLIYTAEHFKENPMGDQESLNKSEVKEYKDETKCTKQRIYEMDEFLKTGVDKYDWISVDVSAPKSPSKITEHNGNEVGTNISNSEGNASTSRSKFIDIDDTSCEVRIAKEAADRAWSKKLEEIEKRESNVVFTKAYLNMSYDTYVNKSFGASNTSTESICNSTPECSFDEGAS